MSGPAMLALHIMRPLSWLGGQALWIMQPFADALGLGRRQGSLSAGNVARLLEREHGLDELSTELDRLQSKESGVR